MFKYRVLAINELDTYLKTVHSLLSKMVISCSSYNCSNRFVKGSGIKFHKFSLANAEIPTPELSKSGHNSYSSVEVINRSFDRHNATGTEKAIVQCYRSLKRC